MVRQPLKVGWNKVVGDMEIKKKTVVKTVLLLNNSKIKVVIGLC